jgi:Flp pilus assembly protein TadD
MGDLERPAADRSSAKFITFLLPLLVFAAAVASFLPALRNEFVNWDDDWMLLENLNYRGFDWTHLRWMFTTFHAGHYQPLSWLTLALDYRFWSMDPTGYHLTNLLIHGANAVCSYFIARHLLRLAVPDHDKGFGYDLAALVAALFFAVHPLRVESVVWATERRDVLSGFFFLLTILFYLNAVIRPKAGDGVLWLSASLLAYALSLLSKASGMTVPVVLIILDVYPLRRLGSGFKKWFGRETQEVWLEKLPFFLMGIAAGVVALLAQGETEALARLETYGLGQRVAQAVYGLVFYLWKTLWPAALAPLYPIPNQFDPLSWPYLLSGFTVIALTILLFLVRHRWPAALASWVYYVVVVAPVLGFAQSGVQFVADRYTYLSCLSWAVLLPGAVLYSARRSPRLAFAAKRLGGLAGAAVMILAILSWRQTRLWHDSERLWRHAIAVQPSGGAYNNLGTALLSQGKLPQAAEQFGRAVSLSPGYEDAYYNLGIALARAGKPDAAIENFQLALKLDPADARAHNNLAITLLQKNQPQAAIGHFRRVVELKPKDARAYNNLGTTLAREGRLGEAMPYFRRAVELNPDDPRARSNLARTLLDQGDVDGALGHLQRALELDPKDAELHSALGMIAARRGDLKQAIEYFKRAVELAPNDPQAHSNLGVTLGKAGDLDGATREFETALKLNPQFAQAHGGLAQALALQGRQEEAERHYNEAMRLMQGQH